MCHGRFWPAEWGFGKKIILRWSGFYRKCYRSLEISEWHSLLSSWWLSQNSGTSQGVSRQAVPVLNFAPTEWHRGQCTHWAPVRAWQSLPFPLWTGRSVLTLEGSSGWEKWSSCALLQEAVSTQGVRISVLRSVSKPRADRAQSPREAMPFLPSCSSWSHQVTKINFLL